MLLSVLVISIAVLLRGMLEQANDVSTDVCLICAVVCVCVYRVRDFRFLDIAAGSGWLPGVQPAFPGRA